MKPLRAILIYVAAILVLGSLLAPWLYWGGHWLAEQTLVFAPLNKFPFHRYFNRSIMIVAFVGLFWVVRALGVRRLTDVLTRRKEGGWREFRFGFGVGIVSIAVLATVAVVFDAQKWNSRLDAFVITQSIIKSLAIGLTIGLLEEIFFRGGAYGGLRRGMSVMPALLISSVIFSVVHFLKPSPVPKDYAVQWWSGFETLATCGQTSFILPYFVTLMFVGIAMGWIFEKTGALYLPFGLHAGWVFALQLNPKLFEVSGEVEAWFGGVYLEKGWAAVVLMALTTVVTVVWFRRGSRRIQPA